MVRAWKIIKLKLVSIKQRLKIFFLNTLDWYQRTHDQVMGRMVWYPAHWMAHTSTIWRVWFLVHGKTLPWAHWPQRTGSGLRKTLPSWAWWGMLLVIRVRARRERWYCLLSLNTLVVLAPEFTCQSRSRNRHRTIFHGALSKSLEVRRQFCFRDRCGLDLATTFSNFAFV